jgi:phenylacetate-coenzyme A ligase PaaK-like adenylate-forming protein
MGARELTAASQYALASSEKHAILAERLRELTALHRERCEPYRRILSALDLDPGGIGSLDQVPMLPIGLFKSHVLRSIPEESVFKVVTSSGTTGAAVSRVYLDAAAAQLQTRTLASIMTHWLGTGRRPMLIVDAGSTIQDRRTYSARGAGIVGMATFGRDHCYALDDDMQLARERVHDWCARHRDEDLLVFGFTFMVWEHLVSALEPGELDLSRATLVHSGGWKKLAERSVGNDEYKATLERVCGLRRVHNFYGMAEQIGTVFVECEHGYLHAPNVAELIVRDPSTWEPLPLGQPGVAQMLSALPESYPGHSILTEDLARIEAVDTCPCGRRGTTVSILGRVPEAELRGCSDTHAQDIAAAA